MSKSNDNHEGIKLYAALTNELTNMCYGYAEVTLSSVVPKDIEGETRDEFLYRIVNSVRNIENSNIHGFIIVRDRFFVKFYIRDGRAIPERRGRIEHMDYKVIGSMPPEKRRRRMIQITNEIDGKLYELVEETHLCNGCAFLKDGVLSGCLDSPKFNSHAICAKLHGIWKEVRYE